MKFLIITLSVFVIEVTCRSYVPLNMEVESQSYTDGAHSVRVHRVAKDEPISISMETIDRYDPNNLRNSEVSDIVADKSLNLTEGSKAFVLSQGPELETFLTELAGKTVDTNDNEETVIEWLKHLRILLKELSGERAMEKRFDAKVNEVTNTLGLTTSRNKAERRNVDVSQDTLESVELAADNQRNQDVKYNNKFEVANPEDNLTSSLHGKLIEEDEAKIIKLGPEYLDEMLVEAQNLLERIRRYFDKLCRKHHSRQTTILETERNRNHAIGINQPKKASVL